MSPRRGLAAWLLVGATACAGEGGAAPVREPAAPLISIAPDSTAPAAFAASVSASASAAPPAPAKDAPSALVWAQDEGEARARAGLEGRPLLVYLRAGWSVGSLWMEREVWTEPRVVASARGFVALRLDLTSPEGDAELYAQRYGATALPAVVIFDVEGRRAALLLGAQRPEALLSALESAAE